MVTKFSGYAKSFVARSLPNGNIIVQKAEQYFPDAETEVYNSSSQLRDITDAELNEIMEELAAGPKKIEDNYPLKGIRTKVLNE